MRARPLSAIVSHPQPTVTLTGACTDVVVQESLTSSPIGRAAAPAFAGAELESHVQTRPDSSVTVRFAIAPPSLSRIGPLRLSHVGV